jgi:hypothetical protein
MIGILIQLLIVGIIIGLIWWVVDYLPVPQPLNKMIKVVTMVIGVIIIIYALLSISGVSVPRL